MSEQLIIGPTGELELEGAVRVRPRGAPEPLAAVPPVRQRRVKRPKAPPPADPPLLPEAPPPWPLEPAAVATTCDGRPVAMVWRDPEGMRWVVHRFGEPVVEGGRLATGCIREELGAPAAWAAALERLPDWMRYDLDRRERSASYLWPPARHLGFQPMMAYSASEAERLRMLGQEMRIAGVSDLRDLLTSVNSDSTTLPCLNGGSTS